MPDGVVAVLKRDCPTCELVAPVIARLAADGAIAAVYSQDDPAFPDGVPGVIDDRELAVSFHLDIETVPTVVRVVDGREQSRVVGWEVGRWSEFFGVDLGAAFPALPPYRPGCGSRTHDVGMPETLAVRFGRSPLRSRRVELASAEDEAEAMYDRGWSDGLPLVAPTEVRVLRMLAGTTRAATDVVAVVPPNLVECTVEKVAVNAVMAGCRPEYLPVVLTAVEAACTTEFNAHGLLATTHFAGPVLVVNGPIAPAVGINSGVNVFGQGTRANSTIGRALQLVIRNVGGGRPGGVDRATFGNPGKAGLCFAESEGPARAAGWMSLAEERGVPSGTSAVTLFAGEAPRGIVDQKSRTAASLARSFAACLRSVGHPKLPMAFDAIVAVSPEHLRTFAAEGWDRRRLVGELQGLLQLPGSELVQGAGGISEGIPSGLADRVLPKFRDGGLLLVHCGGDAGMFSAVMGGWVNGAEGSEPVTREVTPWV
ncbi:thioredoxin family protein [Acidiferrimicrobium sp. IK]|nr:thioredoxin family protein [Acidiferrimicrobium sp. IK]